MKKLNSRNKKIKWFHDITGFPFSKCRQKLREKGDFDKVCDEYYLDKMQEWEGEMPVDEVLMGSIQYVKMSGSKMTPKLHILEHIAGIGISELNSLCVEGKWFKYTDVYFACDYKLIAMDLIDSDFCRCTAEIMIEDSEALLDPDEQNDVIKSLVEDILSGYIESDFFEWDE